jgi:hypothetical protein
LIREPPSVLQLVELPLKAFTEQTSTTVNVVFARAGLSERIREGAAWAHAAMTKRQAEILTPRRSPLELAQVSHPPRGIGRNLDV